MRALKVVSETIGLSGHKKRWQLRRTEWLIWSLFSCIHRRPGTYSSRFSLNYPWFDFIYTWYHELAFHCHLRHLLAEVKAWSRQRRCIWVMVALVKNFIGCLTPLLISGRFTAHISSPVSLDHPTAVKLPITTPYKLFCLRARLQMGPCFFVFTPSPSHLLYPAHQFIALHRHHQDQPWWQWWISSTNI